MSQRRLLPCLVALLALSASGCVERWLLVRSDPAGAQVFLDAQAVGTTPVRIPFDHYGTHEVLLRLENPSGGRVSRYQSEARTVKVSAPWYEWFPIDLVSEFLWPGTLVDEHVVDITLRPVDLEATRSALEQVAQQHREAGSATDAAAEQP